MRDYHETTVDKFTFTVAKDRWYNSDGIWVKEDGGIVRIGLSDFLQQRSGDIAFAEVKQVGIRHPPLRPKRKSPAWRAMNISPWRAQAVQPAIWQTCLWDYCDR
jgi:hypothetical protein